MNTQPGGAGGPTNPGDVAFDSSTGVTSRKPACSTRQHRTAARLTSFAVSRELVWALIALGAVVRVREYLANRSLWLDESFLSLNLIEKPIEKLFGPLQFNQAAPPGFLLIEKLAIELFGPSEYVLRAFPLVCGLVAVPLFAALARQVLPPIAVPVALALFVLSSFLIYYSSEVKPYSADVAVTVAFGLITIGLTQGSTAPRALVLAAVGGALLIQISTVGVIVAAASGIVLAAGSALRRSWATLRARAIVVTPWAISAAAFLWVYRRNTSHYTFGEDTFARAPTSRSDFVWWGGPLKSLAWLIDLYHTMHGPTAVITALAAILACAGGVVLLRRDRVIFALSALIVAFLLVASTLHKYPLVPRTLLFLTPALILVITLGLATIADRMGGLRASVLLLPTALLLAFPAADAVGNFAHPKRPQDMKGNLRFIAQHWRPGDTLYLHYPTQFAFAYYNECDCFSVPVVSGNSPLWPVRRAGAAKPWIQMPRALISRSTRLIVGRFAGEYYPGIYRDDVAAIRAHRRAWILMTFVASDDELSFVRRDLLSRLDRSGRRVLSRRTRSAWVYLYRFSKP
ncbi:MAG TPA: glycosyltransferase family 39 protein [Gaiellaceae bacterium]